MSEKKNLAAILYGKLDLRMEERSIALPREGEVLLELHACGICGTDVHVWLEGADPRYLKLPVVLGHECSGIVMTVGPGVTTLQPGDRVAVELEVPCRRCGLCKEGKYNLCKPWSFGGLQRYRAYAADFCHKLPQSVNLEQGALLEPLACGVRGGKRGGVGLGDTVLVCGAGSIGLSALLAAKARGAARICVTDVDPGRLQTARKMGATHTVLVTTQDARELAAVILATLRGDEAGAKAVGKGQGRGPGEGVDVSIECSGVESSVQAAIYATKSGGTVVHIALDTPEISLDIVDAATREVDIKGVFSYCNDYPAALAVVASGNADPLAMVTHRYPLSKLHEALELVRFRRDGVIKVIIDCQS